MADRTKVEGIDYSPEGIVGLREALIAMRGRAMGNWPEGIDDTVVLSHAIALMADYAVMRQLEDQSHA